MQWHWYGYYRYLLFVRRFCASSSKREAMWRPITRICELVWMHSHKQKWRKYTVDWYNWSLHVSFSPREDTWVHQVHLHFCIRSVGQKGAVAPAFWWSCHQDSDSGREDQQAWDWCDHPFHRQLFRLGQLESRLSCGECWKLERWSLLSLWAACLSSKTTGWAVDPTPDKAMWVTSSWLQDCFDYAELIVKLNFVGQACQSSCKCRMRCWIEMLRSLWSFIMESEAFKVGWDVPLSSNYFKHANIMGSLFPDSLPVYPVHTVYPWSTMYQVPGT